MHAKTADEATRLMDGRQTDKPGRRRPQVTVVQGPEQLRHLLRTPRPPRVSLTIPQLDEQENRLWEGRLNREAGNCGCGAATAALLVTTVALLVAAVLATDVSLWIRALAVILGAAVAALVSKLVVAFRSRQRYRQAVGQLWIRLGRAGETAHG